jgi:hypothetical protein
MSSIRIGSKMRVAADYVAGHPGCTKMAAAAAAGPNGSLRFGYAAVDRAIRAGLIRAVPAGPRYQLYTT